MFFQGINRVRASTRWVITDKNFKEAGARTDETDAANKGWNCCGFKSKIWRKVSQETPVRQGPEGCRQIDNFFTQNFITWSIDGWDVLDAHVPQEWFIFIHRSSSAVVFSGIFNKTQTSFAALRFATIPSDRWRRKSAPCHRFFCLNVQIF